MKMYKVVFEDFRDSSNIIQETQYCLGNCLGEVYEAVKFDGEGYDKELLAIIEICPSVRKVPEIEDLSFDKCGKHPKD